MALSDLGERMRREKYYGWNKALDNVIPDKCRDMVADASILLRCINNGGFEEAVDYLFGTKAFAILMWNEGDYEKASRVDWLQDCRLTKFTFKDRSNKERTFSILNYDDVMTGICGTDYDDILRVILHIVKHNINSQKVLSDEEKLDVLRLLFEVVKDSGVLDFDSEVSSQLYPMGKYDYIYFEKDNYIQTTLFDETADFEYEGIRVVGASNHFAVQGDNYDDQCAYEVSIVYPWEEEKHTLKYMAFISERRTKKLLEDIFCIERCSVWDDVM